MFGAAGANRRRPQRSMSKGHAEITRTRTRPRVQRNATFDASRLDATSRRVGATSRRLDIKNVGTSTDDEEEEYITSVRSADETRVEDRRRIRFLGPTPTTSSDEGQIEQDEKIDTPVRLSELILPPGAALDPDDKGTPASSCCVPANSPVSDAASSIETTCSAPNHENPTTITAKAEPESSVLHTITTSRLRGMMRLDERKEEAIDLSYRDLLRPDENITLADNNNTSKVIFDGRRQQSDSCRTGLTESSSFSNRYIGQSSLETLPPHNAIAPLGHPSHCACPKCQRQKLENLQDDNNQGITDSAVRNNSDNNANPENKEVDPSVWQETWQSISKFRQLVGKSINHRWVQGFIVIMIILNAMMMGLGTFDFVEDSPRASSAFEVADQAFLIIFTIESSMQLFFHGFHLFLNGWLTFDLLIVVISWAFSSLQVFRTFRTLRLIARIETLRKVCQALLDSLPRITAILFLFLLVMYIFAVLFTVLFGDLYAQGLTGKDDFFSRLDVTAFSLFQMNTLDWAKVARPVMMVYPWTGILFSLYIGITSFILFSLIIAVVCDAVSIVEAQSHMEDVTEPKEADSTEPKDGYEIVPLVPVQARINNLQHRINHLKNQQLLALSSIQDVMKELQEQGLFADKNDSDTATDSCTAPTSSSG